MAYDLDAGDIFRLPGDSPWSEPFLQALATLMSGLTHAALPSRQPIASQEGLFDREAQIARTTAFLTDLIEMP